MVIELTKENFSKEVEGSQEPVIIDFFANWCGPCQMMKPVFEKLSEGYKGKLKFAKVDTEKEPELAHDFRIQGIPALVLVSKGEEVDRIVGYNDEDSLKEKIDNSLKKV
jgi:thioredoxin